MKYPALFCLSLILVGCGGDNKAHDELTDIGDNTPGEETPASPEPHPEQDLLDALQFPTSAALAEPGALRLAEPATMYNPEAVIPPQCYTKHETKHNPCMTCHQSYPYKSRPNTLSDGEQQTSYIFSDIGVTNHWKNLFEDRSERIENISDQQVIDYIYTDNYSPLIAKLKATTDWQGPIPEIQNLQLGAEAFDEQGFAKDGSHWVAFNYKPLPSTFWPTNGSTDDVMIRLPAKFRQSSCGGEPNDSRDTYLANLSILEAAIKDLSEISTPDIDEKAFCVDLNGDEKLGVINTIIRPTHYVGDAADETVTVML